MTILSFNRVLELSNAGVGYRIIAGIGPKLLNNPPIIKFQRSQMPFFLLRSQSRHLLIQTIHIIIQNIRMQKITIRMNSMSNRHHKVTVPMSIMLR